MERYDASRISNQEESRLLKINIFQHVPSPPTYKDVNKWWLSFVNFFFSLGFSIFVFLSAAWFKDPLMDRMVVRLLFYAVICGGIFFYIRFTWNKFSVELMKYNNFIRETVKRRRRHKKEVIKWCVAFECFYYVIDTITRGGMNYFPNGSCIIVIFEKLPSGKIFTFDHQIF
jgi:hypothetical protein